MCLPCAVPPRQGECPEELDPGRPGAPVRSVGGGPTLRAAAALHHCYHGPGHCRACCCWWWRGAHHLCSPLLAGGAFARMPKDSSRCAVRLRLRGAAGPPTRARACLSGRPSLIGRTHVVCHNSYVGVDPATALPATPARPDAGDGQPGAQGRAVQRSREAETVSAARGVRVGMGVALALAGAVAQNIGAPRPTPFTLGHTGLPLLSP